MCLTSVDCNRTWLTLSSLLSAAFRMPTVVIPTLTAANATALWVQFVFNILVPRLALLPLSNKDLSHLARVNEHTSMSF